MYKKDFEKIAADFKHTKPKQSNSRVMKLFQWKLILSALIDTFYEINPRFNKEAFLNACGYYDD